MRFVFAICAGLILQSVALGQVNSGSDGHDGALNPTSDVTIDMADHPDGIYQYPPLIPGCVKVSFAPMREISRWFGWCRGIVS